MLHLFSNLIITRGSRDEAKTDRILHKDNPDFMARSGWVDPATGGPWTKPEAALQALTVLPRNASLSH